MKIKAFRRLLIMVLSGFIVGCANSKLHMELSIYKDDPLFKNVITQNDIKTTGIYLAQVNDGLESAVQTKIEVADDSYYLFDAYWMAQGEVYTLMRGQVFDNIARQGQIDALVPLQSRLVDYKGKLYLKASEVRNKLAKANASYNYLISILPKELEDIDFTASSYVGQVQRQQRLQQILSIEVSLVHQALNSLIEDTNHPFYQSTQKRWGLISALIMSQNYQNFLSPARRKSLNDGLLGIAKLFKNAQSSLISLRPEIEGGVDSLIESNESLALVNSMMKNPNVYGLSAEEESQMLAAVDLLNSQLDRLQIASSPVWRIVTDPKNNKKWNTEFSETYFYAEGNAGVVVVRDSPIKYRMQEASNNPAALVQAQLQVSRAVADAAIQMAGAATGVPLVSVTKEPNNAFQRSDNTNYQQETETMMTKQARLGAKKAVYQRSLESMEANIDSYIRQLSQLKPADQNGDNDKDKINELNLIIVQYLKAQQALMTNTVNQGGK
jgi:hypothetical protein